MGGAATAVEAFIDEQVGPKLRPGESIGARAYLRTTTEAASQSEPSIIGARVKAARIAVAGPSNATLMSKKRAYFAALTDQRLFLIEARVGVLKPILENRYEMIYEPGDIRVSFPPRALLIEHRSGQVLWFKRQLESKHVATQRRFFEILAGRAGVAL